MTPRTAVTYLRAGISVAESMEQIRASEHSRMVVVGETLDDVHGFALRDELLLSCSTALKHWWMSLFMMFDLFRRQYPLTNCWWISTHISTWRWFEDRTVGCVVSWKMYWKSSRAKSWMKPTDIWIRGHSPHDVIRAPCVTDSFVWA